MNPSDVTFKDYLQLHFVIFIWGFTAILGKLISIPAVELVLYRTLIAFLILGVLIYFQRKTFFLGKKEFLKVFGTGLLIAGHWILFFGAARVSNVSACLVGMATSSLWTSILEPIVNKKKISILEIGLGLSVIAGLYLVFQVDTKYILGVIMAIGSAMLASGFSIVNSHLVKKHDSYTITFYEMIGAFVGSVLFLPFYIYYFSPTHSLQLIPNLVDWIYIFILSGVCTVYAFSMGVKLLKKFTAFIMNLTVNLEPVYGIILAFLIFGEEERMTPGFYVGTLIILLSVIFYPILQKQTQKISSRAKRIFAKQ